MPHPLCIRNGIYTQDTRVSYAVAMFIFMWCTVGLCADEQIWTFLSSSTRTCRFRDMQGGRRSSAVKFANQQWWSNDGDEPHGGVEEGAVPSFQVLGL